MAINSSECCTTIIDFKFLFQKMDLWYLERIGVLEHPLFVLEADKEEVKVGSDYRVCDKILPGRDIELVHSVFNRCV